ncbi:nitroreductase [Amycolatopsis thermophila]|uniref:Nitroreductase n=1 Tax=Amycolatopsis thermophila TaxID=206084 RepID=A0ABU0F521_9PSEU|nr:nitroreductase [Amycolatopsis thermophila]
MPDDVLARCLRAATWAPSGSNAQPWRMCVLRSPEVRRILGPAYRRGFADLIERYGTDLDRDTRAARTGRATRDMVENFEAVPLYVLLCLRDHRGDRGPAAHRSPDHIVGASVFPAMQNLILALRAEGLGTVPTTWFRHCEEELRAKIGIPDHWEPAVLLPVGYPRGRHVPVRRRPVADMACDERWTTPFQAGSARE